MAHLEQVVEHVQVFAEQMGEELDARYGRGTHLMPTGGRRLLAP